jgi:hypothetical protein
MASGSTPRLALPYPLETDTPDVAADIHSLATALDGLPSRGATNIPTSESRSSISYGTLTTPDQVTGIVLPTNGLIRVWYQATWSESISGSARAAIFLGSNQVQVANYDGAPHTVAAATSSTTANFLPLSSCAYGLVSGGGTNAYSGDVTTGQVVGVTTGGFNLNVEYNGTVTHPFAAGNYAPLGGPCDIFAAAGTYTVSIQFKVVAGSSITVKNRQLWVQALSFG